MPGYDVERRVFLLAGEELAADLVHDCQHDEVRKISGTRESILDVPSQGD